LAEPNAPPDGGNDDNENRGGEPFSWRGRARRLGWWLLIAIQAILIAATGEVVAETVIRALS
jgi:hypothetical protein